MPEPSDEQLLLSLRNPINCADEEAFSMLYKRYQNLVYRLAHKQTGDANLAEDIVQDVFAILWQNRTIHGIRSIKAFLLVSVRNRVFNLVSKGITADKYLKHLHILNGQSSPSDHEVISKELRAAYENLVKTIPEKGREIFKLRFEDELSSSAIAAKLDMSQKTVQNLLALYVGKVRMLLNTFIWIVSVYFFY